MEVHTNEFHHIIQDTMEPIQMDVRELWSSYYVRFYKSHLEALGYH